MNTENISIATGAVLIIIAIAVDALDFVLALGILGIVIDIPAAIFFGICFSHNNVSMMHHDRVLKFLTTIGLEAIPILDDLPTWTYTVTTTVWHEWHTVSGV